MTLTFEEIKKTALEFGWDDVGITKAQISLEDIQSYQDWLASGYQADLSYMEKTIRCRPEELFPGAKTALIFVSNYKQPKVEKIPDSGIVASYARGRDYHHIHRKRLKKFIAWIENRTGQKDIAKGFSDSTPIMEKALAVQAGLGWFGKNTLLIHRKFGTFTLLSGVLLRLEIPHSAPSARLPRCGVCTRCLDGCPTQAFTSPYTLDAAKCLSYNLIESKKEISSEIQSQNPGYIFGCDVCQDVCPHNVKSPLSLTQEFSPENGIGTHIDLQKLELLKNEPEKLFGTPLQRRGVEGLIYSATTLFNKTSENE